MTNYNWVKVCTGSFRLIHKNIYHNKNITGINILIEVGRENKFVHIYGTFIDNK